VILRGVRGPDYFHTLGVLTNFLGTLEHNLQPRRTAPNRFERFVANAHFPASQLEPLYAFLERQGEEVLPRVDLYMHQREKMCQPGEPTVRVGIGIYIFEDPVSTSVGTASEDRAGSRNTPPLLEKWSMRISEDRYARDLRRLNLAHRLIRHEVRTQWIRASTGFSEKRVRNLFHSYDKAYTGVRRRRGPSPTRLSAFLHSLRNEASAIGGLACVLGAVPDAPATPSRPESADLEAWERLVDVFELYHEIVPQSQFKMTQFIQLVNALTEGKDLAMGHCGNCHGALLVDPLGTSRRLCPACIQDSFKGRRCAPGRHLKSSDIASRPSEIEQEKMPIARQQSLFWQ
jgi:hypothetical protein